MNNQVAQVSKKAMAAAEPMVPVGYKQTEVGVIPEDWDSLRLDKVCSVIDGDRGSHYPNGNDFLDNGHCVFLSATNVTKRGFRFKDVVFITKDKDAVLRKGKLKPNDIVLTTRGSVGNFAFFNDDVPFEHLRINSGMVIIRNEIAMLESEYLFLLLDSDLVKKQLDIISFGSAQPQLTVRDINGLTLCFPESKEEQTTIANALSDMDALIGSLEALIAKKQAIKTATMQQLLTGRTRLPQFAIHPDGSPKGYKASELGEIPEDWAVVPFGSLFDSKSTQRKKLAEDEEVSFVGMQDVSESSRLIQTRQLAYSRVKSGLTYFERGDVLVAKITPCFENGKGCHTETLKTEVGFGSTEFHVLKANQDADSWFIYFWTIQADFRMKLESEMVGSAGHRRVPLSAITAFNIPSPSCREEQTAIAAILSDMDEEIQALETRLAKTRDLKQGIMQQLLTGKIRLVKPLAGDEHHAG